MVICANPSQGLVRRPGQSRNATSLDNCIWQVGGKVDVDERSERKTFCGSYNKIALTRALKLVAGDWPGSSSFIVEAFSPLTLQRNVRKDKMQSLQVALQCAGR